ncbi:hypothetical protein CMO96_01225 [Candidatus Woesebacteria bacterium]|nr:hypothetical protein [Candidatus Woesebacteria bacterium]|tara:strand:- start:851 stop:2053 length:1203 start_codon:yes stop_codon:yes gene_type:complete
MPHTPERPQRLANFVRGEAEKFRSGEIDSFHSSKELAEMFGYSDYTGVNYVLRKAGVSLPVSVQRERLLNHVQSEIGLLQTGQIDRLTSMAQLGIEFGYAENTIHRYLRDANLLEERKTARLESKIRIPPSYNLAWMIGVLACGCTVRDNGLMELASKDRPLLLAFKSRGEDVFKKNATRQNKNSLPGYQTMRFGSKKIVGFLGELGREGWTETVRDRHDWILKNDSYVWGFLEGVFETRGWCSINSRVIGLTTTYQNVANFLAELLVKSGIEHPDFQHHGAMREGIIGVRLQRLNDLRRFAENVHSVVPEKEERLEQCRRLVSRRGYHAIYTDQEIIDDWKFATELLGRSLTTTEYKRLDREGKVQCGLVTLCKRFGSGSFPKARENLNRIATGEEEAE